MSKTIDKPTPNRQPFEKFEGLAKKLMTVSKKELDEKLAEYERAKKRRKRKGKT